MNLRYKNQILLKFLVLILLACGGQDKEDASNFFLKGNQAFVQNNYTEALRLYDEAIDKNKEFSDAYLNKGICLIKMNRANDAYEVLTEAIRIDPTLLQAILVRAEAGLLTGKLIEAEQDLKQISKDYKDSSKYYLIHGNIREAQGRNSEAMENYDKAISLNNFNVEALVNRGAMQYHLGAFELAEDDFDKALKINPGQLEALNNMGLIATKTEDWDTAISYFDLILNSNPSNALALNNKGYVLIEKGKVEEAIKMIDRSLDIMPANGYALRNLGIAYQKQNKSDAALAYFNKAIDLAEPVEDLYGLTGKTLLLSGKKAEACKIWQKGIVLKDALAISEFQKNCK